MNQAQAPQIIPLIHLAKIFEYYHRQGPSYVDTREVAIITVRGKALYAITREFDAGYPYNKGGEVAIIPTSETELIVIRIRRDNNTSEPGEHYTMYYVYVAGFGWWLFSDDVIRVEPDNIALVFQELDELGEGMRFI